MSAPLAHPHLTYDDLCQMLPEGSLCDLIDGEAYMTPSPNARHQILVGRLHVALLNALQGRSLVLLAPMDVVLARDTALQPDLVVVLEGNRGIVRDVVRGVPDLVVEVLSPSTARRDTGLKLATYARHGVPEAWIVGDKMQTAEIYRLVTGAGAYQLAATCRAGDHATTPLLPRLSLEVASLFAE